MYYVYLIFNIKTKKFYVGVTQNVNQRSKQHKNGENKSTQNHCGYWKLVYCEIFLNKSDAYKRERKLKHHGYGIRHIKDRIKNTLDDIVQI